MKGVISFITSSQVATVVAATIAGVFFITVAVEAATTISTDVITGGGIYASSTAQIDGNTTLSSATLSSTLSVTGLTSLGKATSTMLSGYSAYFGGSATTTISTAGSVTIPSPATFSVGGGTAVSNIAVGFCNLVSTSVTASSSVYAACTGATGVQSTDRVFVQATSSMGTNIIIAAASSTATDTIGLRLINTGVDGNTNAVTSDGIISINFWAAH